MLLLKKIYSNFKFLKLNSSLGNSFMLFSNKYL